MIQSSNAAHHRYANQAPRPYTLKDSQTLSKAPPRTGSVQYNSEYIYKPPFVSGNGIVFVRSIPFRCLTSISSLISLTASSKSAIGSCGNPSTGSWATSISWLLLQSFLGPNPATLAIFAVLASIFFLRKILAGEAKKAVMRMVPMMA
jgi:hypothetical protein